jgi:hypothetical protein
MAKTIVITGSSDGIGAAAARQLHRDGHQVLIVRRFRARRRQLRARSARTTSSPISPTSVRCASSLPDWTPRTRGSTCSPTTLAPSSATAPTAFFVVGGRYGLPGALPVEAFHQALATARQAKHAADAPRR